MERKVSVYPFPFGTRVFMHRNGVIREAEYRGMRIKDTGICGNNVDTEHIFWFGSKLGEEKFKVSMPKYEEKEDDYFPFSSASIVAYEYKLLYHEKFFEHLHMKRLVIDENIPFPVSTWERSYRYKGYGYNMCRETKKKLLQAIKGVNVEEEDVSLYTTGGWD